MRKYTCDDKFFKYINSPTKAYLLGIIASDGNLVCRQKRKAYTITQGLHEDDIDILTFFKESISFTGPIRKMSHGPYLRLEIRSKEMYEDLIRLGITPRKSLILSPPPLNKSMIKYFLLGFFDGDGGISFTRVKKRKNTLQAMVSLTSTWEMCQFFTNFLKTHGFDSLLTKRFKDKINTYTLLISGNYNVIRFLEFIYEDAPFLLKRKYERYLKLKEDYASKAHAKNYLIAERKTGWFFDFEFGKQRYQSKFFKEKEQALKECEKKLRELGADKALKKFMSINYNDKKAA